MTQPTSSLTSLLADLKSATPPDAKRTQLRTIINTFEERGFAVILFFLALPAALPIPALGINMIIALPIILLTLQQLIGRHRIWLPEKVKKRTLKTSHLHGFIDKSMPLIRLIEKLISPRLRFMCSSKLTPVIGFFCSIFAASITLPVPLTNTVPAAAIALTSIGIIMADGLAVIAGIIVGVLWISLLTYAILFFGMEGIELIKEGIKAWLGLS